MDVKYVWITRVVLVAGLGLLVVCSFSKQYFVQWEFTLSA